MLAVLGLVAICYLGVLLLLLALENRLLYYPARASDDWVDPATIPLKVEDVELTSADGTRLHAWWCPLSGGESATEAMLFCHGNAGNLSHRAWLIADWHKHLRMPVLIFDYPGYGKSAGSPSEAGCYAAADAAYDWLVQEKGIPPQKILLCGESLGGGVAVDLAGRQLHRAVVLLSSFTSVPDVAQLVYPWLPVKWLMRNRFDNLGKIADCHSPLFLAHGLADTLIPPSQSERLYAAASQPKKLLLLPGHDHNTALPEEFFTSLRQFLADAEALPRIGAGRATD